MAEEKKSIVESELNPLNHLDPFITGVASPAVFDSDLFLFTHLGLFGLSGFSGSFSVFTLCTLRYALCSIYQTVQPPST
jgi:hypothetical protein